jgi:hypothetical protein
MEEWRLPAHWKEMTEAQLCKRCNRPVVANTEQFDVFEQMHWLCFHLEFEHEGDPDRPCQDPSCPWWHIEVFKGKLEEMGIDIETVMKEAVGPALPFGAGSPHGFPASSVPRGPHFPHPHRIRP